MKVEGDHEVIPYRPDVDGLRAVAVVPVVAFHAGLSWLPGGFIGVDVFFVISGYLIGAQVFRQSTSGTFRYLAFYARRLRRIVPALIALLVIFLVVGALLLTPDEFRELGKESVAAVFGASNLVFFLQADYFAPAADLTPLLHTWSLGVEEQFYIVLPILAAVFIRVFKSSATKPLVVVTVLSMAASIVMTHANPQAAFYLLPTRFWELSLGAILATSGIAASPKVRGALGQLLGLGGATLIVVAMIVYRPEIPFPGAFVLLPTIGAAMVIAARSSWVNARILSNPVAVFVGKISYSWYLWHWPLFYFSHVLGIEGRTAMSILAALSFGLAVLSWRFIEQPFRRRRLADGPVVLRYVMAIACVAALGTLVFLQNGFIGRLPADARIAAEDARRSQDDPCLVRRGSVDVAPAGCQYTATSGPTLAIIGDSHAASISPGFEQAAAAQGLAFRQLTKTLCTAQWGYANVTPGLPDFPDECFDYQRQAFQQVEDDPNIEVVVLAARWHAEQILLTAPGESTTIGLETALDSTLTRLQKLGKKVVLVQEVPELTINPYATVIGQSLPMRVGLQDLLGVQPVTGPAPYDRITEDDSRDILRRVAAKHPNVVLVDPWAQLCDADGCHYRDGSALYYFDEQHLSGAGAVRAVGTLPPLV
ncbi:acyltransferase [Mycobacterium antarcticum]|uniref:acyltransferase family protein n=1 Tax=Mycolicibacterium sp. TUM20983 TaxID=3023369 RepID=UPI002384636E|nr:acyltransferase family protein [Mycolicibacterium sp. TUM20983]GLP77033.1 acyltransferase [Mycolicibacterium sp. TUM20983]